MQLILFYVSSLSASVSVTTRALVNIFSRKLDHFQAKNELNVFHLFNDAVSPLGAALLDVESTSRDIFQENNGREFESFGGNQI